MITQIILHILIIFIQFILTPFTNQANVVLPSSLTNAIVNVQGFYASLNPLFPIDTLLVCMGFIVAVEVAIFAYKGIMWLIKKIPTIS